MIKGDKALMKALNELGPKTAARVSGMALRKAALPIVAMAKANVQSTSPTVAASIGLKARSKYKGAFRMVRIGPLVDTAFSTVKRRVNPFTGEERNQIHNPWKTAHLIEGGTKAHQIRLPHLNITVNHPGAKARPFLQPALDDGSELAVTVYAREMDKAIQRAAKRAAKNA